MRASPRRLVWSRMSKRGTRTLGSTLPALDSHTRQNLRTPVDPHLPCALADTPPPPSPPLFTEPQPPSVGPNRPTLSPATHPPHLWIPSRAAARRRSRAPQARGGSQSRRRQTQTSPAPPQGTRAPPAERSRQTGGIADNIVCGGRAVGGGEGKGVGGPLLCGCCAVERPRLPHAGGSELRCRRQPQGLHACEDAARSTGPVSTATSSVRLVFFDERNIRQTGTRNIRQTGSRNIRQTGGRVSDVTRSGL
eukprot:349754-Chlamydomonas_euryale.AAC.2